MIRYGRDISFHRWVLGSFLFTISLMVELVLQRSLLLSHKALAKCSFNEHDVFPFDSNVMKSRRD